MERICPEEHLNLSKSGFVSEEDHSGCKAQNIAIRALKENVDVLFIFGQYVDNCKYNLSKRKIGVTECPRS